MQVHRWGRFIARTSVAVKQPLEGLVLSNSIRCGVGGLVKTLAAEYGPYNVLVNNVCPGYTATDRLMGLAQSLAAQKECAKGNRRDVGQSSAVEARRAPRGVGQRRGVSGLRTCQLCHGRLPRSGRRNHKGVVLSRSSGRRSLNRG